MRANRLVFIFVLVVLAAFIYGITTNTSVKDKDTLLYNPNESLRFPVQTIQNTGQFDGLLRRTEEEFRTIDAINLYQESGDQKLSKVVFGKLKGEPKQYAFVKFPLVGLAWMRFWLGEDHRTPAKASPVRLARTVLLWH